MDVCGLIKGESIMEENTNMPQEELPESKPEQELFEEITQMKEDVSYLRDLFVRRLNDDKQKSAVIGKLAEAATYTFIEPFLHDIILLMDRLEKSEDDFVVSVKEELFEIINRRGVEKITVAKEFDPTVHKAIKAIEDPNAEFVYISETIRNGYVLSGKVIRPAEVVVVKPGKD